MGYRVEAEWVIEAKLKKGHGLRKAQYGMFINCRLSCTLFIGPWLIEVARERRSWTQLLPDEQG